METKAKKEAISTHLALLGSFEASQASFAGRKCANLSQMKRAGFQIPRGFGISGKYFLSFLKANGINATDPDFHFIVGAAKTWPNNLDHIVMEHLQQIIESVEESPVPVKFAVRSSGMEEDSEIQAFAGMHDTILNVGKDEVLNAIKTCWASALNHRATAYALDASSAYMPPFGVIVQLMIDSKVGGVAFTRDPLTGDDEYLILNFAQGSGDKVVSGAITPHEIKLPRARATPRTTRVSHPLITTEMFEEMRQTIILVESLFGTPQDIEWCFDSSGITLWILQSRPITTLSNDYMSVSEHLELPAHISNDVLSSKNTIESMNFVPTALTWTTFNEVIDSAFRQRYQEKQIDYYKFCGETRSFYELRQGHVYQNVTLTCELNLEEFGIDFTSTAANFGLDSSSLAELLVASHRSKATSPGSMTSSFSLLKTLWSSGNVTAASATVIERELDYCVAERKRLKDALPTFPDLSDLHSTFEVLLDRFKNLATTYVDVTIHASVFEAAIGSFLGPENQHLLAPLTANVGGVYTSTQNEKLLKVAKELELLLPIKKDLLVSLLEKTATPQHESLRDTISYIEAFCDEYGFRAELELEVSSPRWWDDAPRFLDMINLMNSNSNNSKKSPNTQSQPKDKEQIIYEMSSFMTRPVLRWAVNQLNDLLRLRENGKYVVVFFIALARMIVLESGKRLAAAGLLLKPDDVFYLPVNDFRQSLVGMRSDAEEIQRCISANVLLRRRWLRQSLHREIIGFKPVLSYKKSSTMSSDELQGTAASPGCVEGIARVILLDETFESQQQNVSFYQRDEVLQFQEGEILVTRTTNPAWTPLFMKSKAIVVEYGGLLSHGAITARELGLPAVVAVREMSLIRTGDTIYVDGDRGIVRIIKRAPVVAPPVSSSLSEIANDDEIY